MKSCLLLILLPALASACSPGKKAGTGRFFDEDKKGAQYLLPFPPGKTYYLLQGNHGSHSHSGTEAYAYDFRMPVGSPVTAMRAGKVVTLREQFRDGSNSNDSLNFLIILHADSTAARYLHLTHNGVLVEPGQWVRAGDTIALSGHSGRSTEPHLHVDVTGYCTRAPCQTIPFSFHNSRDKVPRQGRVYKALSR